jgi:hypothetical protein
MKVSQRCFKKSARPPSGESPLKIPRHLIQYSIWPLGSQWPNAQEVIYRFSLVKAAMNTACVCKLRNGVNKTPQFLLFSMAKGGTKTIAHFPIAEG